MLGGTAEFNQPSGSGSSGESGFPLRKRARKDGLGDGLFDLNLPAEVVDRN
jgi:ariadne-1